MEKERLKIMINFIRAIFIKNDLLKELVLRNIKIRYSTFFLGFLWAFLLPFSTALVFFFVFSSLLKVNIEEAPFLLYVMSAVFSWRFFQDSVTASITSLIDNKNLIRESNFPVYLIPFSIVFTSIIHFLPALLIIILFAFFILQGLAIWIFLLPVILAIHLALTLGLSVIVSMLYLKYRQLKFMLEVILMLLFYLTPVFYPITLIKNALPGFLYKIYNYNPLVIILNLYRFALLKGYYKTGQNYIEILPAVIISAGFSLAIFWFSARVYRGNKNSINDYLAY